MKEKIFFVSGIDTDAGKSYATGFIAKEWAKQGLNVITQKLIQTGNTGFSEDILIHREIMEMELNDDDKALLTMPEVFSYPASPHLAARIDKREIDFNKIEKATNELAQKYDRVLVEGAGGLMTPLTEEMLTIDYITNKKYPLIFITSGKLGSINHTLLSFEAIKKRKIELKYVAYNLFHNDENSLIQHDNLLFIERYMQKMFPKTKLIIVPKIAQKVVVL